MGMVEFRGRKKPKRIWLDFDKYEIVFEFKPFLAQYEIIRVKVTKKELLNFNTKYMEKIVG